jgi:4-amino-4-deoxy-L-arabinose transferase-like glycosyltransferase
MRSEASNRGKASSPRGLIEGSPGGAGEQTLGWRAGGSIFAVALAWRFAYLGHAVLYDSFFSPWLDARWHLQWASEIAAGKLTLIEPFFRAPLYPYFLAVLLLVTGGNLVLVRVGQILLGSATAVLVGVLGARLYGRRVGLLAGLLYASAASIVLFDLELLIAVVLMPLTVGVQLALERATRAPSWQNALATGLLMGLAAVARPNILLFVPVALLLILGVAWKQGLRVTRVVRLGVAALAGLAIPIAPVSAHNLLAGHDLVMISSQGGVNFFIGNNAGADGYTATAVGLPDVDPYARDGTYTDNVLASGRALARQALGHEPTASETSRYWYRQARAWIRSHPRDWLTLMARKTFYLTGGFEIGDNKNLAAFFAAWPVFRFMARWWWLFPLAVVGSLLPGQRRATILLVSFAAVYGASIVAFFVCERYRLVLFPAVCVLAARFLVWALDALRGRSFKELTLHGALAVSLSAWTLWDPTGYTVRESVQDLVTRSQVSEARGRLDEAERLLIDALNLSPDATNARLAYGHFLERHGRVQEAAPFLKGERQP